MAKQKCGGYVAEIQERMDGDVLKAMLEVMAQRLMEEELALHLRAERHERTQERRGHRNGYKGRRLKTRLGELALQVPQARGVEPYSPMLFAKWQRSERALLVADVESEDTWSEVFRCTRTSGEGPLSQYLARTSVLRVNREMRR
ncbi:MAG: transposase [Candidatus Hydrogenedentales bacterium]